MTALPSILPSFRPIIFVLYPSDHHQYHKMIRHSVSCEGDWPNRHFLFTLEWSYCDIFVSCDQTWLQSAVKITDSLTVSLVWPVLAIFVFYSITFVSSLTPQTIIYALTLASAFLFISKFVSHICQTTNLGCHQTERVCRRQNKCYSNAWMICLQKGRKTL